MQEKRLGKIFEFAIGYCGDDKSNCIVVINGSTFKVDAEIAELIQTLAQEKETYKLVLTSATSLTRN
jgi:hypothetical protein